MKSKNVPRLRFREFRDAPEWERVKLNKLGNLVSGLTYSPDDVRESGLLVLRSSNVQNGGIKLEDNVYVRTDIKGANLSEPNDILICVRNGSKALIGKNALIPNNMPLCTHGAFMTIFRAKLPKFIFQLFQTSDYERQVNADLGATINSINGKEFLKYEFFVPTENEQQKIADCLTSLDDLIAAQSAKAEALKKQKKALMQQLFPREGERVPRLRFSEFRDAPEWEEKKLGDIANVTIGEFVIKTKQNPNSPYPVYNGGKSYTGFYDEFNNEGNKIIISARGANAGYVNFEKRRYWAGNSCYSVDIADKNLYYLDFFYHYIKKNENRFIDNQQAANIPSVSKSDVLEFKVSYPKLLEQQKITAFLTSLDDLITAQSAKVETLKEHKKALMQQLFPSASSGSTQ